MLDEAGHFEFTGELLGLVERLWCSYQEARGSSHSRSEQLAGLAYIVAALHQEVEAIYAELAAAPELQGVELPRLLEEELGSLDPAVVAALKAEMRRRGWLG
jgi:hypothetical protein